jgi:multidrug resistance efflux pump
MADDAPRVSQRNAKRFTPLFVLATALALFGAYRFWQSRQPYEWGGTVEARAITVGSRVGGRVKEVLVREGEHVDAGQALIRLEPGDLEAQLLMAEGQLAQAQAALEKLERGARPEELAQARARAETATAFLAQARAGARSEEVASARARLSAADAALEKARADFARAESLFRAGALPRAEFDAARAQLDAAQAERDARASLLTQLETGTRREELEQAAARAAEARASAKLVESGARVEDLRVGRGVVTAAEGRVRQVQALLDELVIRAPRPSRVEALDLRPGDLLGPNAPAATLLEDDQLFVRIYVPETKLALVRVGDELPVTVDTFPDRAFPGVVEHINARGEFSPRNLQTADERANQVFATRVVLREGNDVLRAGMAAFIRVPKP